MMAKILIIEDTVALLDNLMDWLFFEGFEVIGAEDGMVGLQKIREHLPDLIICDVIMPKLDGFAVIRELRSDPAIASIPFIFMTAKTDDTEIDVLKVLGADAYLSKPVDLTELRTTIQALLK
jgi:DNA-binding response OmpR family regulator